MHEDHIFILFYFVLFYFFGLSWIKYSSQTGTRSTLEGHSVFYQITKLPLSSVGSTRAGVRITEKNERRWSRGKDCGGVDNQSHFLIKCDSFSFVFSIGFLAPALRHVSVSIIANLSRAFWGLLLSATWIRFIGVRCWHLAGLLVALAHLGRVNEAYRIHRAALACQKTKCSGWI